MCVCVLLYSGGGGLGVGVKYDVMADAVSPVFSMKFAKAVKDIFLCAQK